MAETNDPNLPLIESARSLIAASQLAEAAKLLNQARQQVPTDPRVFMMAGLLAEKAGNIAAAFQQMQHGIALAPNWAPGIIEVARLQARQGQFPEAAENATSALTLEPKNTTVLEGAIEVAQVTGQTRLATNRIRQLLKISPNSAQWRTALATGLGQLGAYGEALEWWNRLVAENPKDPKPIEGRMHLRLRQGQLQEAALDTAALLALEPDNPIYAYYDACAHGQTPAHQPPELNRRLFDATAPIFDQQLVQGLRYRLPEQIAKNLLAQHPDRKFDFLDLGCGTGLLGAHLGKLKGRMVGADVSPNMLEQARRHGLYDELKVADLHDMLRETPPASWDVIAALDVCVYVGDLGEAILGAFRALVPGGRLVFSCEAGPEDGPDLHLNPVTGRYAHKRSAVKAQCHAAGFQPQVQATTIRYEKNQPVHGFIVWAHKPA